MSEPYPRADGRNVRLGVEEQWPSSPYPLWSRAYTVSAVGVCPACVAMVKFDDIAHHNAWHRQLATQLAEAARSADPRLFA